MQEMLEEWYKLRDELADIKRREAALRKQVFETYFPCPVEGTNSHMLDEKYVLKAKLPYTRKIDEAAFTALYPELEKLGVDLDKLVKWKPEIALREYRTLTAEQLHAVDQFLTIQPGSAQLEIVEKKK